MNKKKSQLLTDRSTSRKKALNPSSANKGGVSEKRQMLEQQFEKNAKKAVKPSPNAMSHGPPGPDQAT